MVPEHKFLFLDPPILGDKSLSQETELHCVEDEERQVVCLLRKKKKFEEKKYYCVQSNVAHYELFHALRPNPLLCQNSAEEVK